MGPRLAVLVATLGLIALATPAPAPAQVTCSQFSLIGNYVITLAGIGQTGEATARMLFVAVASADAQGRGTFTGTQFFNDREGDRSSANVSGNYQVFPNCLVHLFIPKSGLVDTVTGFVLDFGDLAVLSSVFDPGNQLTGVMRKIH